MEPVSQRIIDQYAALKKYFCTDRVAKYEKNHDIIN
jgi:hypothetical protein